MERQLDFFCFLGKHIHVFGSKPSGRSRRPRENHAALAPIQSVRSIMLEQNNRPFVGKLVKLAYIVARP